MTLGQPDSAGVGEPAQASESRARSSAWTRPLLLSFASVALALSATMWATGLSVAWISYSTPELKVFTVPRDVHSVALFSEHWLVINRAQRSVVTASVPPVQFEMGGLALIRLDRLRGALLGDGVKGDEGESWAFTKDGVDVTLRGPSPTLHIPLPSGQWSVRVRNRRGEP